MAETTDDLFAPPVEAWQRLSPKYLPVMMIGILLGWLIVLIPPLVVLWIFLPDDLVWVVWAAAAASVALLAWRLIRAPFAFRRWGYAERGEDVYLTRGLMQRRLTCVPYGRMQLVEVQAGPIERLFGLASVSMITAAPVADVSIPGLDRHAAEALRDRFINRGEHLKAGI